jgi:toxin ParE1/3/4
VKLPLEFHPAVTNEIVNAHKWYEHRRAGLGKDFLNEVQRKLAKISLDPAQYGFADDDVRECQLTGFPFAIYYQARVDCVRIIAVFHTSRDPSRWQLRT